MSTRFPSSFVFVLGLIGAQVLGAAESSPTAAANTDWGQQLEAVLNAPKYKSSRWGFLVTDLRSGEILFERDADKLFAPASTTKLFSVAAALATFGAEHRFETPLYARGWLDADGVLHGDLILRGRGDLTLGGRTDADGHIAFTHVDHTYANGMEAAEWTQPDPLAGLNELARQVAAAGVKRIEGDVLVDDRLFEPAQSTGSGPSRLTPILVNDNLVDFLVTPKEPGAAASVEWRPKSAALEIDAQVKTVSAEKDLALTITAIPGNRMSVRGQIPAGHNPVLRVSEIEDPPSFARTLLIEALGRAGLEVTASALAPHRSELLPPASSYRELRRVAALRSPPFREEMKLILKVSHNLHASLLPLLLAARRDQRTLSEGLELEARALARFGVDIDSISFAGGAGGSRSDYTTPRATVALLRAMSKRGDFDAFKAALPVLGVDGTLKAAAGPENHAYQKVHAKTGTLFYDNLLNGKFILTSKALAGYMTTSRERELAFAMFLNHTHLAKSGDTAVEGRVLAQLCEILHDGL